MILEKNHLGKKSNWFPRALGWVPSHVTALQSVSNWNRGHRGRARRRRAGLAESNGVFQRGEDSPLNSSTALREAFFNREKHSHHSQPLQQCRGRSHMDEQGSLSVCVCVCVWVGVCMNMCFRLCSGPASVFQPTLEFLLTCIQPVSYYWSWNWLFSGLDLLREKHWTC